MTAETQERASLYVLDGLLEPERTAFEAELHADRDLKALVRRLRDAATLVARVVPSRAPSPELKAKVLQRISMLRPAPLSGAPVFEKEPGLWFKLAAESSGWSDRRPASIM